MMWFLLFDCRFLLLLRFCIGHSIDKMKKFSRLKKNANTVMKTCVDIFLWSISNFFKTLDPASTNRSLLLPTISVLLKNLILLPTSQLVFRISGHFSTTTKICTALYIDAEKKNPAFKNYRKRHAKHFGQFLFWCFGYSNVYVNVVHYSDKNTEKRLNPLRLKFLARHKPFTNIDDKIVHNLDRN